MVQPNTFTQPVDGRVNGPLERLRVTVGVRRRFSKKSREQFAELLGSYLASVRTSGLFGEGPVAQSSNAITFYPRVAQFQIDASRSGQNTINWLILMLVGFSTVNLVTEVYFTEQVNAQLTFNSHFGLANEKAITLQIPEISEPAPMPLPKTDTSEQPRLSVLRFDEELEIESAGDGDWAAAADPSYSAAEPSYLGLTSSEFPISATPAFSPDDCVITIFFEQLPTPGAREKFTESIQAWFTLGQLGAFGGSGFGLTGEVVYDSDDDSARFFCDLGPTDANLALQVLVNVLGQWHSHGMVIKEVVLGR